MKEIDDNLLTEFLEGKLDEPANREIENWYDASEENRRRLEALYFVLFAGDRLPCRRIGQHRPGLQIVAAAHRTAPHENKAPMAADRGALRRHPRRGRDRRRHVSLPEPAGRPHLHGQRRAQRLLGDAARRLRHPAHPQFAAQLSGLVRRREPHGAPHRRSLFRSQQAQRRAVHRHHGPRRRSRGPRNQIQPESLRRQLRRRNRTGRGSRRFPRPRTTSWPCTRGRKSPTTPRTTT